MLLQERRVSGITEQEAAAGRWTQQPSFPESRQGEAKAMPRLDPAAGSIYSPHPWVPEQQQMVAPEELLPWLRRLPSAHSGGVGSQASDIAWNTRKPGPRASAGKKWRSWVGFRLFADTQDLHLAEPQFSPL